MCFKVMETPAVPYNIALPLALGAILEIQECDIKDLIWKEPVENHICSGGSMRIDEITRMIDSAFEDTTLDKHVIATIMKSPMEQMASRIAMNGLFTSAGVPGFGSLEQNEIDRRVDTQLGMMGIF